MYRCLFRAPQLGQRALARFGPTGRTVGMNFKPYVHSKGMSLDSPDRGEKAADRAGAGTAGHVGAISTLQLFER
jgi:hypothetical protein